MEWLWLFTENDFSDNDVGMVTRFLDRIKEHYILQRT